MLAKSATAPQASLVQSESTSRRRSLLIFIFTLAGLLTICYLPMLRITARFIWAGEDMAHGLFAPVVALFLAWDSRAKWLGPAVRPSWWSLPVLSFAACVAVAATLANSSTVSRMAFLVSLAGCILLIGGWRAFRILLFPLTLLLFTFPIPDVLYGELTMPLQLLATRLSEVAFEVFGFSVVRDGNVLRLAHMQLSVVEACSGLRSLITLLFFCLVYAKFFEERVWLRFSIVACSIPAAILVNMLRITATGVLAKYNPAWTTGLPHAILGWSGFFVGFCLVLATHAILKRLARTAPAHS